MRTASKSPLIMGVLNVTPDSFSDGGSFLSIDEAVSHAVDMVNQGADIIDVGGESTRPGSDGVGLKEELERVIPVVSEITNRLPSTLVSIDTTKPEVARAAIEAGARMINDVSALRDGTELAEIAAGAEAKLVLMHSRETPKNMQDHTRYEDLMGEIKDSLLEACASARLAGLPVKSIWIDPGIGFAKTATQSLFVLKNIRALTELGHPVLVGPSRKSFIHHVTGSPVADRLGGTAAAIAASVLAGATAVRVHDVAQMKQVAQVAHAIATAQEEGGAVDA